MGPAKSLAEAENSRPRSVFALLVKAAENGWLPDAMIRIGIRRLLRSRLRQNQSLQSDASITDFVRASELLPIAVAADKANDQHYEVPAEFFRHVLGERLKYSCCYWAETTNTLSEAEQEGLRRTADHAGLVDGQDVLELGCGWGSLSLWMAERFPNSRITAVSNSSSQRDFIMAQACEAGLSNLEVITADVNHFVPPSSYDRVVSVEMFEHLRNHRRLMNRIHDWLKPNGKLFVHVFCHKDTPYFFRSDGEQNWMGRYFFTGGMMPSADLLPKCGSRLNLANQWSWSGMHYAKTCRAWLARQDNATGALRSVLAETYGKEHVTVWQNRWRMFFMACEELFAFEEGDQWFVSHYLFER